ncbi:RNA-guided pseudouridylation complex pseudouridine synthase subunit Cbf5 [Halobellus clavatus]|uniref:Probable tRNA pseudouridine synthase B n=1 Tax=Halobellus clavatus TaxID=660517 RepID=A0A1H3GKJ0_9EURY|nr:RNA-guided pseudouridylation complex pseudouridine synthase subunit Cbf5 [Halobellus clavatus]SDY03570.1 tRNA pseudouridine55 synthase [Halobellus clavatus]
MTALRAPPAERTIEELLSFGVVNLDKPPGPSAHQVSAWIRDAAGVERAAHAGTLDPKVTGCLPVLLGDATRLAQVFLQGSKEYVAVLELHGPAPTDLDAVLETFEGEIYQKPPRKSAVARRLRTREIYDLDLLEVRDRQALVRIRCESGTYIRKLCHDLGLAAGTGAHMGDLRRTATDPFDDRTLVSTADVTDGLAFAEDGDEAPLRDTVAPAERALSHLPGLTVAFSAAEQIAEGAPVYAPGIVDVGPEVGDSEDGLVACFTPDGSAVCLGRLVGDPQAETGEVVSLERVLV